MMFVYKILTSQEWLEAKDSDLYKGSALDQKMALYTYLLESSLLKRWLYIFISKPT